MTSDTETSFVREYRGLDPIIGLIAAQVNRVMEYRSKKDLNHYMDSVDALVDLLPPEIQEKATTYAEKHSIGFGISQQSKRLWVGYFRYIKQLMSDDNIIWKRSRFEIGKEE